MGDDRNMSEQEMFRLPPGKILQGRNLHYQVMGSNGSGGFAVVYTATSLEDNRQVAIKMSHDGIKESEGDRRIRREIAVLKECGARNKEYIPAVLDEGECDGRPFFVMEKLQPLSWSECKNGLPQSETGRRDFMVLLIEAVKAIHAAGYIHCDIKPSNIMERPKDHRPLLVDFGSARPLEQPGEECSVGGRCSPWKSVTKQNVMVETPGYGDGDDRNTIYKDIFGLGQVIRDCFGKDVDLVWCHIINKCISRQREYRYESLDALVHDIENAHAFDVEEMTNSVRRAEYERLKVMSNIVSEEPKKMTWVRFKLAIQGAISRKVDKLVAMRKNELWIRFVDLPDRSYEIVDSVVVPSNAVVVLEGPGKLQIDLSAEREDFKAAQVILLNGAILANMNKRPYEESNIKYFVGKSCLLHLVNAQRAIVKNKWAGIVQGFRDNSIVKFWCDWGGPDDHDVLNGIRDFALANAIEDYSKTPDEFFANKTLPSLAKYIGRSNMFRKSMGIDLGNRADIESLRK